MRLFLIRHGETVDNVANLYAGSRDSALTAHGVLQAGRLASYFSKLLSKDSKAADAHIFSSNLQRAVKTAEAIHDSVRGRGGVLQLAQLREKHFGSREGARFGTRKDHPDDEESVQSMQTRADDFLQNHLLPLVQSSADLVVVVAHGIILGVIARQLFECSSPGAITVATEAQHSANPYSGGKVPVLPSWSNTGFLEVVISRHVAPQDLDRTWSTLKLHVARVNCLEHLEGLRKTRGGIGSARFDGKQKTIDTFFAPKKRKRADADD